MIENRPVIFKNLNIVPQNLNINLTISIKHIKNPEDNSNIQKYMVQTVTKAGCRWYGIFTKWIENLLFEVIL